MPGSAFRPVSSAPLITPFRRIVATTVAAAVAKAEGLTTDGYRTIFNTGRYGGQEVFHVHAHVLGGAPLGPMLAR